MLALRVVSSVEERVSVRERRGIMFVRWESRPRYSMSTGFIPGVVLDWLRVRGEELTLCDHV